MSWVYSVWQNFEWVEALRCSRPRVISPEQGLPSLTAMQSLSICHDKLTFFKVSSGLCGYNVSMGDFFSGVRARLLSSCLTSYRSNITFSSFLNFALDDFLNIVGRRLKEENIQENSQIFSPITRHWIRSAQQTRILDTAEFDKTRLVWWPSNKSGIRYPVKVVSSHLNTFPRLVTPGHHIWQMLHMLFIWWCSGKSTSHQSSSNPGSDAEYRLSLLLVLSVAPREFSSEVAPAKNLSFPFEYWRAPKYFEVNQISLHVHFCSFVSAGS